MHAHHEMRHAAQVLERRAGGLADAGQRGGVEGVAGDLPGDQDRNLDRLRLALGIMGVGSGEERGGGLGQVAQGGGEPALDLSLGLDQARYLYNPILTPNMSPY